MAKQSKKKIAAKEAKRKRWLKAVEMVREATAKAFNIK